MNTIGQWRGTYVIRYVWIAVKWFGVILMAMIVGHIAIAIAVRAGVMP